MNKARLLPFTCLLAIAACSSDSAGDKCKDSCTTVCASDDTPTAAEITNCENDCTQLQTVAEKRGCDDELADLFDCAAENGCSSTFQSDCSSQSGAANDCNIAYCRSHTSDPDC